MSGASAQTMAAPSRCGRRSWSGLGECPLIGGRKPAPTGPHSSHAPAAGRDRLSHDPLRIRRGHRDPDRVCHQCRRQHHGQPRLHEGRASHRRELLAGGPDRRRHRDPVSPAHRPGTLRRDRRCRPGRHPRYRRHGANHHRRCADRRCRLRRVRRRGSWSCSSRWASVSASPCSSTRSSSGWWLLSLRCRGSVVGTGDFPHG